MQDVAKEAGVSAKTVSRVFNDDPKVAPETRARVQQAMKTLRFQPNMMARRFREGKDSVIGVAVPDIGDPFFAIVIRVIEEQAVARGMAAIVTTLGLDGDNERAGVTRLLARQISGLVLVPVSTDQGYLEHWNNSTPIVFLDREPIGFEAPSVVVDDRAYAAQAARHLLDHGHTRVAFVGDTMGLVTTERRLHGYRDAVAAAGLPADDSLVLLNDSLFGVGYLHLSDAIADVQGLLAVDDPPTAIFSSNAQCSIGLVSALHTLGRKDVAVVSFGDFPMAAALEPPITVIDQDPEGLALKACAVLFDKIDAEGSGDTAGSASAGAPTAGGSVTHAVIVDNTVHTVPLTLIERGSGETGVGRPASP